MHSEIIANVTDLRAHFHSHRNGGKTPQTPGVCYILLEPREIKEAPGDRKMGRGRRQRVARMRKLRERLKGK